MKRIFLPIIAIVALSLATSCSENLTYSPGESDDSYCQYVYFPEDQSVSGEISMTPSSSKALTLVAKRKVKTGAVSVPVEIETATPEWFSVDGPIQFADGSEEATVVLNISEDTPLDQTFSCSVKVTDPQFASLYDAAPTHHDLSIIIEDYEMIGTGLFSDAFKGIEDYPMTLYKKNGENLFRIAEWPYKELFEFYAEKYEYDAIAEMEELGCRYIYFSLDANQVVFESWSVEYYDADAGQIIKAFLPSSLSGTLAAYDAMSTLSKDRKTINMYPYFYLSDLTDGWGPAPVTFVLDSATVPEI